MEYLQREIPVAEFIRDCVDIPRFANCCRTCPNYSRIWSCPPYYFQPTEVWDNYDTLMLNCRVVLVPDALQKKVFSLEEMTNASMTLLREKKHIMLAELIEQENRIPGSMALAAGCCDLCPPSSCARLQMKPCREPGRVRYSIEALGGDVGKALKLYFDKQILWGRNGHMPEYYILLGGLLMKKL